MATGAEIAGTDATDPRDRRGSRVRREVAAAIAALSFNYQAAVVTRYVMGMEYAEAAASLEIGLNTYKSNLLRGTRMLREALAPIVNRPPRAGDAAPEPVAANAPVVQQPVLVAQPAGASFPRAAAAVARACAAARWRPASLRPRPNYADPRR